VTRSAERRERFSRSGCLEPEAFMCFGLAPIRCQGAQYAAGRAKEHGFVGKVIKARNGQYALLTDEQAGKGAYLDDQEKAKTFEGRT
jgi:hypothetical protein